jgi:predicted DNA-binding protein
MTDESSTPISIRLRQRLHEEAQALANQYGLTKARVLQEAIEHGLLTWAASRLPSLRNGVEHYGPYDGPTLARLLRVQLAPVIDLLLRHGELPLLLTGGAVPAAHPAPPSVPPPEVAPPSSTIPFDPHAATEGFPGGMDDD